MKTYREHNEAVQVLVTVTGQTLVQRTSETIQTGAMTMASALLRSMSQVSRPNFVLTKRK